MYKLTLLVLTFMHWVYLIDFLSFLYIKYCTYIVWIIIYMVYWMTLTDCTSNQYTCPGSYVCQDTVTWCDQVPNCPFDADEITGCRKYLNTFKLYKCICKIFGYVMYSSHATWLFWPLAYVYWPLCFLCYH